MDQQAMELDDEGREAMLARELRDWWINQAEHEIGAVIPKAVEYGAADLEVMGTAMLALLPESKRDRRKGLEMAVGFYALGKVARLFGAYERGELPSDDCWHDLAVYCKMAQRIRQTGRWV